MASHQSTVDFIVDQIAGAGEVFARKMFGDYGVFCDGKMVAVICDNGLFVKPTEAGKAYIMQTTGDLALAPPFKGAKLWFVISGDMWEDGAWLETLIKISKTELPLPKKKKTKYT